MASRKGKAADRVIKAVKERYQQLSKENKVFFSDANLIGIAEDGTQVVLGTIIDLETDDAGWLGLACYLLRCPNPSDW